MSNSLGPAQPQQMPSIMFCKSWQQSESIQCSARDAIPSLSLLIQLGDRNVFSTNRGLFSRDFACSHDRHTKHGDTQHIPYVKHFRSPVARKVHPIFPTAVLNTHSFLSMGMDPDKQGWKHTHTMLLRAGPRQWEGSSVGPCRWSYRSSFGIGRRRSCA